MSRLAIDLQLVEVCSEGATKGEAESAKQLPLSQGFYRLMRANDVAQGLEYACLQKAWAMSAWFLLTDCARCFASFLLKRVQRNV